MLVWRSQEPWFDEERRVIERKLENVERELEELRVRRVDGKANERCFKERRTLQQHVSSLIREVNALVKKKDEVVLELSSRIEELEVSVRSTEKSLEEERVYIKDLKEKLREAEIAAEDSREKAELEAQKSSAKIWKHKTAFIELMSKQRRTEAELDRALRQVEA